MVIHYWSGRKGEYTAAIPHIFNGTIHFSAMAQNGSPIVDEAPLRIEAPYKGEGAVLIIVRLSAITCRTRRSIKPSPY